MVWSNRDIFEWNIRAKCKQTETAQGMHQVVSEGDYWELWTKNLVL